MTEAEHYEFRCFGPPGTGKTTWIASSVRSTAAARGSGKVTVCSLTKTAAKEIAGRDLPIPDGQVGTLHALAYRSVDRPAVAQERIGDWNALNPSLALTGAKRGGQMDDADGAFAGQTEGDKLMAALDIARARMQDLDLLPLRVRAFAQKWEAWKKAESLCDFSDMIDMAIERTEAAPGRPDILYADEVQDMSPLELRLLRHWARHAEKLIIAGDDDQNLFHFRGSSPDAFLDPPVPEEQKKVLAQSYRVPVAVHAMADNWVRRLSRREDKEYLPRDAEGKVRRLGCGLGDPATLLIDVLKQTEAGRSVMVQATCSYMLDPIKHEMKRQGIAFHNPYRPGRTDWNPLRGTGNGISSTERVLAYLVMDEAMFGEASRLWTGQDVKRWTHLIKKQGVFRRGATATIQTLPDRELTYEEVSALFDSDATLARAVTPDLSWLRENLLASAATATFPIAVAERSGGRALLDEPQIILGTVHSLKGSQADCVYLAPDLSMAGFREWQSGGESKDAVIRCFYVGITRAREELVVLTQNSNVCVDADELLRGAPR